jgi:hypothetical protein
MKIKLLFLHIVFTVTTIQVAQATLAQRIQIRNNTPFVVQFTIPTHHVTSLAALDAASIQEVILGPQGFTRDLITITIPEGVQFFWINLPNQRACPTGRGYELVKVSMFCLEDPNATYDFYASTETFHLNWFAVFCGYGSVNKEEAFSHERVCYINPDGFEGTPAILYLPVCSSKTDASSADATEETQLLAFATTTRYKAQYGIP